MSDLVGAPVDELMALNPSLLRMVTPPDTSFDLHLPAGTATLFNERIALIPEAKRNSWRYHAVVAGDTLASVAREYRVEPSALAAANQLQRERQPRGRCMRWLFRCPRRWRLPHTRGSTPRAGATRWSRLPIASASRSTSCGAGTR